MSEFVLSIEIVGNNDSIYCFFHDHLVVSSSSFWTGFFQLSTREEIEIGRNSAAFKGREEYRPSRRRRPLAFKKFTNSHLSNWPLPVWFLIDHNGLVRLKTCRRWTLYVRNVVHSFSARSNFSSPPSCIILQTWWHARMGLKIAESNARIRITVRLDSGIVNIT